MEKEPWGLIIYNRDKRLVAFTDQLFNDEEYNNKIQHAGHQFNCNYYYLKDIERIRDEAERKFKYKIVSLDEVFSIEQGVIKK